MMKEKGIHALGIGSLAKGKFRPDSDIGFPLTSSLRKYKYAIKIKVGDILGRRGAILTSQAPRFLPRKDLVYDLAMGLGIIRRLA